MQCLEIVLARLVAWGRVPTIAMHNLNVRFRVRSSLTENLETKRMAVGRCFLDGSLLPQYAAAWLIRDLVSPKLS
jgi:hypothetical protein